MWFVDSSFVEGVDYAIFFSEDAALAHAHGAVNLTDRIGPSSSPARFWMYNLGAPVSLIYNEIWWCFAVLFGGVCCSECQSRIFLQY